MWRRVAGLPQSGQAGSTSFRPHRRKLSGVGRVFEIALRLNWSSPSSKPWIRRRQERSECMASVHSNHRPWTANCLSLANWLSVSISAMMLRMRFRRETGSKEVVWAVRSDEFASTTVAAQACSTAGGNCRDHWPLSSSSSSSSSSSDYLLLLLLFY